MHAVVWGVRYLESGYYQMIQCGMCIEGECALAL